MLNMDPPEYCNRKVDSQSWNKIPYISRNTSVVKHSSVTALHCRKHLITWPHCFCLLPLVALVCCTS